MKPLAMIAVLSTLCSTSCADPQQRAVPVLPDPAKFAACPDSFPIAPLLTPLAPFTLPDGRRAVLLDTVIDRETATAHYIIEARGAWHDCQSPVAYYRDWARALQGGHSEK